MNDDVLILDYLRKQKLQGIRHLYCRYGDSMEMIASYFLDGREEAKYIVADVIWDLWLHNGFDHVDPPLRKFLYTEIKKACKAQNHSIA